MPRGYRCIVVAFVGWLSLAAQAPNPTANGQQNTTASAVSNSVQNIAAVDDEKAERAHRSKYEAQCNPPNEQRDSDLCAQWKAADAASQAAKWTKISTWVSGLSGLLVLIALGFAFEANRIARNTAKRQLRAYLNVSGIDNCLVQVGTRVFANMDIMNSGQTPAHNVVVEVNLGRRIPPIDAATLVSVPTETPASKLVIAAGQPAHSYTEMNETTQAEFDGFNAGTVAYLVYGTIEYQDIFGDKHKTLFRQSLQANGLWQLCEAGNEAD